MHLSSYYFIEGWLRSILGIFSSFRVVCRMGWDRMVIIGHRSSKSTSGAYKCDWTMIVKPRGVPQSYLTLEWQILPFFLHPGVLFVVPKEEHLMMVLFSSYGWYPKYRVVPETSGLPEISGNTRCLGLPATRWFLKLNRVRSGIERNTGKRVGFGYPLGAAPIKLFWTQMVH